jgi:hypothetical protein
MCFGKVLKNARPPNVSTTLRYIMLYILINANNFFWTHDGHGSMIRPLCYFCYRVLANNGGRRTKPTLLPITGGAEIHLLPIMGGWSSESGWWLVAGDWLNSRMR